MTLRAVLKKSIAGIAIAAILTTSADATAWQTAHGNPNNSGFANVNNTAPAIAPRIVPLPGPIAPGAGPVVGADGTAYIGIEQGGLWAINPDGSFRWARTIGEAESIFASPAIASDGSIFVVGVREDIDPQTKLRRLNATLHRYLPDGTTMGKTPFPEYNNSGGGSTAWPSIWRFNNEERVMVPAVYRRVAGGGIEIRLLAFTLSGALAGDIWATAVTPQVIGGAVGQGAVAWLCAIPPVTLACYLGSDFSPLEVVAPPFPGVGIFTNPQGGTPFILVTNHEKGVTGLTYSGGTFHKTFDLYDEKRLVRSGVGFLSDGRSIVGVEHIERGEDGFDVGNGQGGAIFSGPNLTKTQPISGLQAIYATPTRLANGRTLLLGKKGTMSLLNGTNIMTTVSLAGPTIASAAASHTHVFVSTQTALQTFDPVHLREMAHFDWSGGGNSSPAIGPTGHVYVIADNKLHIFPPVDVQQASPIPMPASTPMPMPSTGPSTPTPMPATGQQTQRYKPPMTANNNRLFACEELDGDDCGKGDHRDISKAFCMKQGFAKAAEYDVDSRKVKAETLDGNFCSKNKCKVFDEIICSQ